MATTTKTPATPKSPAKPVSVSKAVQAFHKALEVFGTSLQECITAKARIANTIEVLRGTKVKLGSIKAGCAFAVATKSMLEGLRTIDGLPLSGQVVSNYLSGIRKCLDDHSVEFNTNMSRAKAKAEGKAVLPNPKEKAPKTEAVEKSSAEKIAVQLNNALVICQNDDAPDYDVVTVSKLLAQILILIKQ